MKRKISFTPISDANDKLMADALAAGLDTELLSEVISSFRGTDAEAAVCLTRDALLVRVFDGERYLFLSPIGLTDPWDISGALALIRDYAAAEMIPLCFTDVMRCELDYYSELFRFVDARVYDVEEDLFYLFVTNECDALSEPPSGAFGAVSLREIDEGDKEDYRRLCEDAELNKYWGYDVREDAPSLDAEYHLSVARREFDTGVAVTLGVYLDGKFIGEGVLSDFDFSGAASVAYRLLPEYHGRGLGADTLAALIGIAKKIGLLSLRAEVMEENTPSVITTGKLMKQVSKKDGVLRFELAL